MATAQETGKFAVSAGGRRLAALKLLVKQKRLAKNASVPCIVNTEGIEEEISRREYDAPGSASARSIPGIQEFAGRRFEHR